MSAPTVYGLWGRLRAFVAFIETEDQQLTVDNLLNLYLAYCERIKRRAELQATTRYHYSLAVAQVVAPALALDVRKLQWKTKIRSPRRLGSHASKENLEETASFVQTLLEVTEQLPINVIRGPLPVKVSFEDSAEYTLHCGRPHLPVDRLKGIVDASKRKRALDARERRANDTSTVARAQLVNLRIDAELLIFINQTGSNLTQALQLLGGRFRYQSAGDYYKMTAWKNRANHPVDLRVHKRYRAHFDAYLKWRESLFPGDPDGLTFPFVWNDGDLATRRTYWAFSSCRKLMAAIGRPFVPAAQLRKTTGNFVNRCASRQVAAELLNNSQKTFRENYEEVNHQVAVAELVSFWSGAEALAAAGPGWCEDAVPQLRSDSPDGAPMPDCASGAGCLFCEKNRDLRTFDHVWNLASMHHLKLAELNADRSPHKGGHDHPAALVVERIMAKLDAFTALEGEYQDWVDEAKLRVGEGRYHPFYSAAFDLLESPGES
ncbi:hypothetical protein [Luteimonas changyuni]|uniref:hypothetical protein n=1 Tax=Luteimonas sp. MJ145 TaxID=3129234 RepID=UPI0031BBA616